MYGAIAHVLAICAASFFFFFSSCGTHRHYVNAPPIGSFCSNNNIIKVFFAADKQLLTEEQVL